MICIINRVRTTSVDVETTKKIIAKMVADLGYDGFDVGVLLTTNKTIQRYNRDYRKQDKPTDILSFPYHSNLKPGDRIIVTCEDDRNLGDIIISLEYVKAHAAEWDRTIKQHLHALLAHGIAHLLNYDHQTDQEYEVMQKVESTLLQAITQDTNHLQQLN